MDRGDWIALLVTPQAEFPRTAPKDPSAPPAVRVEIQGGFREVPGMGCLPCPQVHENQGPVPLRPSRRVNHPDHAPLRGSQVSGWRHHPNPLGNQVPIQHEQQSLGAIRQNNLGFAWLGPAHQGRRVGMAKA